jgi:hypothetical protein
VDCSSYSGWAADITTSKGAQGECVAAGTVNMSLNEKMMHVQASIHAVSCYHTHTTGVDKQTLGCMQCQGLSSDLHYQFSVT